MITRAARVAPAPLPIYAIYVEQLKSRPLSAWDPALLDAAVDVARVGHPGELRELLLAKADLLYQKGNGPASLQVANEIVETGSRDERTARAVLLSALRVEPDEALRLVSVVEAWGVAPMNVELTRSDAYARRFDRKASAEDGSMASAAAMRALTQLEANPSRSTDDVRRAAQTVARNREPREAAAAVSRALALAGPADMPDLAAAHLHLLLEARADDDEVQTALADLRRRLEPRRRRGKPTDSQVEAFLRELDAAERDHAQLRARVWTALQNDGVLVALKDE